MKLKKDPNAHLAVAFSLLTLLAMYTLTRMNEDSLLAYLNPDTPVNPASGYPGPVANEEPHSAYPAPEQPSGVNHPWDDCLIPIHPTPDTLNAIDPCPTLPPSPTPSPTPNPGDFGILHMTTALTLQEKPDAVAYQLISPGLEQIPGITVTTHSLTYHGPLPSVPPSIPNQQSASSDLVDNWELLFDEGFEGTFPQSGCVTFDDNNGDSYERYWGADDDRPLTGLQAGWPAKEGADGVEPTGDAYPDNLDSWLLCGPFDLSQADKFIVQYSYWHEILDIIGDSFFFGISTDGVNFQGTASVGTTPSWLVKREHIRGVSDHSTVWLAWVFTSDDNGAFGEGVWLDDLQVWQYSTPMDVCGHVDPGNKGIVLPPYDPTANGEVPIIRPGDTLAVDALKRAGVHWVRLGFIAQDGSIDWQGYDRMVDTLCANGMSVVGLINHETLLRQDYNDQATAEAYRLNFTNQAEFIADYYEGHITYWEVWNEPNLDANIGGAFMLPQLYAPLLDETYQAIKVANPQAQVLFGGLASAWGDSNDYFSDVYNDVAGVRQFDYLAVHPYANEIYGPNPEIYMYANLSADEDTIIDKFMRTMFDQTQGSKHVWITEVGWNSSKGLPNRPVCHDPVLVTEWEQATYLKPIFDTLFNEVTLWNQPTLAVEKIIWYQYMDIGIADPCTQEQTVTSRAYVPLHEMRSVQGEFTWLFGLYRSDKVTPKPVLCAFLAYPDECQQIFLPMTLRR